MRLTIALLEDDPRRQAAMLLRLRDRFPAYPVRVFASAYAMAAWLEGGGEQVLAASLDHDLEGPPDAAGRLPDLGDGRQIARRIAQAPPAFGVLIHTTNAPAGREMEATLREAGWTVDRVTPYDDLAWIDEAWFPALRRLILQAAVPAEAPAAAEA